MPNQVDLSGMDRMIRKFESLKGPDPTPLLKHWELIIEADNRQGVLAGTDRNGAPMVPVTYRPDPNAGKGRGITASMKLGVKGKAKKGAFGGFGPMVSGLNNNLSTEEYKKLDGPPLAPRGQYSRVITNLKTKYDASWPNPQCIGYWDQVVSVRGIAFLKFHFEGAPVRIGGGSGKTYRVRGIGSSLSGRIPVRDLRGVRPDGMRKARESAREWFISELRRRNS